MDIKKSKEFLRLQTKLGIDVLWTYILSMLKKKPSHAYVLRKEIQKKFGFLPGNVTAYVVLYKLESRGFVQSKKQENKKVYTITEKGKKLFQLAEKEFKKKQKELFS